MAFRCCTLDFIVQALANKCFGFYIEQVSGIPLVNICAHKSRNLLFVLGLDLTMSCEIDEPCYKMGVSN